MKSQSRDDIDNWCQPVEYKSIVLSAITSRHVTEDALAPEFNVNKG